MGTVTVVVKIEKPIDDLISNATRDMFEKTTKSKKRKIKKK